MNPFQFEIILQKISAKHVSFILVGGLAAVAHGMNTMTNDVDIFYDRTAQNITNLVSALKEAHPQLRTAGGSVPFLFDEKSFVNTLNFTLDTDWGPVDLLGELLGVKDFQSVKQNSKTMTVFGVEIQVISLDDLIACKKAAGRTKDKLHLLELEALREIAEKK